MSDTAFPALSPVDGPLVYIGPGAEAALPVYAKARRWHVRAYQWMSWAFTPQYQSDSRWLPVVRDRVLFPLSMLPPVRRILSHLVCGTLLPAFPRGDPLR